MFLKTLTLKGFKSFADPTTLEFEPGITVVVGPNGSGKSNVVDAVAWVLGAQGPKVVRSTKMDDVIFAGTSKRPALGRAEVSLTIDNASRRLPMEVAEVTITRTLFRTGESEYAINGAPCRLLDIQELLSDAGVGRQQHVIVSQGQLDSVLQARPEDRRMVIEEAAGILKFRRRREQAERRLESSEQNLVRLSDLQREVRRQLRPLERQAEAARRHDGLVGELRALRLHLAGRELGSLAKRLESAERSHGELTSARSRSARSCRASTTWSPRPSRRSWRFKPGTAQTGSGELSGCSSASAASRTWSPSGVVPSPGRWRQRRRRTWSPLSNRRPPVSRRTSPPPRWQRSRWRPNATRSRRSRPTWGATRRSSPSPRQAAPARRDPPRQRPVPSSGRTRAVPAWLTTRRARGRRPGGRLLRDLPSGLPASIA